MERNELPHGIYITDMLNTVLHAMSEVRSRLDHAGALSAQIERRIGTVERETSALLGITDTLELDTPRQ